MVKWPWLHFPLPFDVSVIDWCHCLLLLHVLECCHRVGRVYCHCILFLSIAIAFCYCLLPLTIPFAISIALVCVGFNGVVLFRVWLRALVMVVGGWVWSMVMVDVV